MSDPANPEPPPGAGAPGAPDPFVSPHESPDGEAGAVEQAPASAEAIAAVAEPAPPEPDAPRAEPRDDLDVAMDVLPDAAAAYEPEPAPSPGAGSAPVSAIPAICRGLGLALLEGASVGMAGWALFKRDLYLPFVGQNVIDPKARTIELGIVTGLGFLACAAFLVQLLLGRRTLAATAARLEGRTRRLAPLAVLGPLPLLFDWKVWTSLELSHLVLVWGLALGAQAAFSSALAAPPLGLSDRLGAILRPLQRLAARPSFPLVVVCLGALAYAVFFSYHTLQFHWNTHSRSFDLGIEDNIVWNLLHGSRPLFKCSPAFGPTGSHAGYHATWFAFLILPFYAIYQGPETLLVLQATICGAAAIPLFLVARRYVTPWVACLVGLCYVLYPPVHGANLYDFHYVTLGPFFHWTTLALLLARKDRWAILLVIITISVREDVACGLAILGAWLIFTGERPRAGLAIALAGGGYFVVMKLIVMPKLADHSTFIWMFQGMLPAGETGFGGVLKTAIGNPAYTLGTLLDKDKLLYVLELFVPLAFLPLRRPLGLLFVVPGLLFTLLSTGYPPLIHTSFQYTANWTSYLFIGVVATLAWAARPRFPGETGGRIRQRAYVAALVLASVVVSYQQGAMLQQHTAKGGFGAYIFGTTPQDRQNRKDSKKVLESLPPRAKVVSAESLVPQVSSRADSYTIRFQLYDAEYAFFLVHPTAPDELRHVVDALKRGEFGVVTIEGLYVLARRGHSTARNAEVLTRMGYPPAPPAPAAPAGARPPLPPAPLPAKPALGVEPRPPLKGKPAPAPGKPQGGRP